MQREWIVDICPYPLSEEELSEFIPLGNPDDVLVVDVAIVILYKGRFYPESLMVYLLKESIIVGSIFPPSLSPLLQIAKLYQKDSSLQGI